MAKFSWIIWGAGFSLVLFFSLYFLVYTKLTNNVGPVVLMLGNINISNLANFFSNIVNVIWVSLVIGFLLGLLTAIGSNRN